MPKKIFFAPLTLFNFLLFASFLLLSFAWLAIKLNVANDLNSNITFIAYLDIIRSHASLDLALCLIFALNFILSIYTEARLKKLCSVLSFLFYILIVFYFLKLTGLYAYTHDTTPYSMIEYGTYLLGLPFAGKTLSFIGYILLPTILLLSLFIIFFLNIRNLENRYHSAYKTCLFFIIVLILTSFIPPIQKILATSIAYHPYIFSAFASQNNTAHNYSAELNRNNNEKNNYDFQIPLLTDKNIVIVILESFGASTLQENITPVLHKLKLNSLSFEYAYAAIPHTSKALVTIHCGKMPFLSPYLLESNLGTYSDCLASELKKHNYQSVYFQSVTQYFENREALIKQLGFDEFIPLEKMNTQNFEAVNYFGYEDDIMLPTSKEWLLKKNPNQPFIASYLTGTSHHNYDTPSSFPIQNLDNNKNKNRYLNAAHYVDRFVGKLIQQYKSLGLYENTIFVFVGDHGEGFGDHRPLMHNNNLYNSGLNIPLIIHDGNQQTPSLKIQKLTSQSEITELLKTLLNEKAISTDTTLKSIISSCWYPDYCYSIIQQKGSLHHKLILDLTNNTRELYELSSDPKEMLNLINKEQVLARTMENQLLEEVNTQKHIYTNYYENKYHNYLDLKAGSFSSFKSVTQH